MVFIGARRRILLINPFKGGLGSLAVSAARGERRCADWAGRHAAPEVEGQRQGTALWTARPSACKLLYVTRDAMRACRGTVTVFWLEGIEGEPVCIASVTEQEPVPRRVCDSLPSSLYCLLVRRCCSCLLISALRFCLRILLPSTCEQQHLRQGEHGQASP